MQNEWTNETNELAGYISKWNEYHCKNIVTEQTYPGLRHLWIVFNFPDTEQRLLFCSLHFEVHDFPVLGLRVWAVTSAVKAWFSHENIFGFDIPCETRKRYYASRRLCWTLKRKIFSRLSFTMNSSISGKLKGIACSIHEKYRQTAINIIKLRWLVKALENDL